MRFNIAWIVFVIVAAIPFPYRLQADEGEPIEIKNFTAGHWSSGLHLAAGMGLNTSYFKSDLLSQGAGLGLNLQTNVGYYFFNDYAFEVSTDVAFNRVKRLLIWSTMGTLGLRVRLPTSLAPALSHPYVRFAGGRGPSVFINKGQKPKEFDLGGDRTQIEGNIFSLAYGILQNARDGTAWFLEFGGTTNYYRTIETIVDKKDVPEVISSQSVTDHSVMYALKLTFGVVVF